MGYLLTLFCQLFENLLLGASGHLTISTGGIIFLASPVFFTAGPYAMVLTQKATGSLTLGILAMLLVTVLLSFVFIYAYQKLSYDSYAVFTLAAVLAFDALIKSWDKLTGGVLGIVGVARPSFATSLEGVFLLQLFVALIFMAGYFFLFKSSFGRQIRALRESKTHLNSLGVSADFTAGKTILLASLFAAIAGILAVWRIQFLDPTYGGIPPLIHVITIAILAYQKKWKGFLISTVVVTALPELLRFTPFPSALLGQARVILYSVIVIVMLRRLAQKESAPTRSL